MDWQAAVLRAISKGRAGGKLTPVPITRAARWCLRRHIQSRDCTYPNIQHVGRLFPVTMQQLRHDWEAAKRAIGRPDLRFHDLRHTFAQRLEDAGMGDMISYALHHGDPKLRERYSKVRLETLRQRLDSMGKRRVGSDGQAPLRRWRSGAALRS